MNCDELHGDYELYALGVAEEPERSEIRAHLERRCAACESGVGQALGLVAALGAAASPAAPPARLRRRVLASVGVAQRHYGWPLVWAAVALLCLVAATYFSGRERRFAEESLRLRRQLGDQAIELRRLQSAFAIIGAPGAIVLSFGQGHPALQPSGRVVINPSQGLVLIASHLPPAPAGRIYQMWIVPKGGSPRPAGVFQPHGDGTALHVEPGPLDLAATASIAVTVENKAGASQPTSQYLIVAALPASVR
ncbi:MAG TPA: anti-sigma factor [Bryobacteraceae bacterium]